MIKKSHGEIRQTYSETYSNDPLITISVRALYVVVVCAEYSLVCNVQMSEMCSET